MEFEKICMIFSMQEPFYGILLSSMERVPDKTMPTLGVGKFGNVFKLYYNPDWVQQFNTDTVLELLKHEVLHLALNHFITMEDKEDGTQERHQHCNVAIDLEANCYINRNKVEKAAGGVFVEDFGFPRSLGSREYFDLLSQKAQSQKAKQPNKPCNGGQGNDQSQPPQNSTSSGSPSVAQDSQSSASGQSTQAMPQPGNQPAPQPMQQTNESDGIEELLKGMSESFDDHSRWPDCDTEQEREMLQQAIDDMVEFAAEEVEKKCGQIPGELAGRIERIRKKPRPIADWKRYFRRFCGYEFTDQIKKSKKRPSKRFPDAAGNRHRRKSHILVAIDTSGSVSMPEYREFMGQILTLKERATFHVVECDTCIQHEYDFKGKPNEILHGGGGTNFQPPIDLFNENRKKYEALVYFTDGYANIPHNTPKETLWVISSKGDHNRRKYKINGANSVFIK